MLSEPIKTSLERHEGCVYREEVLCMFLCVYVEKGRIQVDAEGPGWKWVGEISHTAVLGVCVSSGGLLLCVKLTEHHARGVRHGTV